MIGRGSALSWMMFGSGMAALVYQLTWIRMLSVHLGATVGALTLVLSVFMAGLGAGSLWFGRWADRRFYRPDQRDQSAAEANRPVDGLLRAYATLECSLAAYAVLLVVGQSAGQRLFAQLSILGSQRILAWLTAAVLLLLPTVLMGGTFPLLGKYAVATSDKPQTVLHRLYIANLWGAVAGCLVSAFLLMPTVGLSWTVVLAAIVNVAVGLAAWAFSRSRGRSQSASQTRETRSARRAARTVETRGESEVSQSPATDQPGSLSRTDLLIAFWSGLGFLAAEVLLTRLLVNFVTANVQALAVVLAGFLTGSAVGAAAVSRLLTGATARRSSWLLLLISGGALTAMFASQSALAGLLNWLLTINASGLLRTHACLLALSLAVTIPAIGLGMVFPALLASASHPWSRVGWSVASLSAMNTLGAITGSATCGFLLIRTVGVNASLLVIAAGYLLLAATVAADRWGRLVGGGAAAVVIAAALSPLTAPIYWINGGFQHVRRIPASETVFLRESTEATVGVWQNDKHLVLTVNGLIVADTTDTDLWDLLLKAHLPMLIHPQPEKVGVIGLGAGISTGAVTCYPQARQIDCVEISPAVVAAHSRFSAFNRRCAEDPRVTIHLQDGRQFLLTTTTRYDVLTVDPVDPPVCNLYTQDFFQLCHDRLNNGGIMVQWLPLFRLDQSNLRVVMQAFVNVFPHTSLWYDGTSVLLMGRRNQTWDIDAHQLQRRLRQPKVQMNLKMINRPSADLLLATFVAHGPQLQKLIGPDVAANTDDFPYLEYRVLRADPLLKQQLADNLQMLRQHQGDVTPLLLQPPSPRLRQSQQLMQTLLDARIAALRGDFAQARTLLVKLQDNLSLNASDRSLLRPFLDEFDEGWAER